jgi:hypothetical protein
MLSVTFSYCYGDCHYDGHCGALSPETHLQTLTWPQLSLDLSDLKK